MSHSVEASLSAQVATAKVCYELYSLMNEVANENNGG
jgi:hypothetical protein